MPDDDRDLKPENRPALAAPVNFAALLAPMLTQTAEREAELAAHRAQCGESPCRRCQRYLCRHCRMPAGADSICHACAMKDRLAAARASVPKRFRWALGADRETILATASKLTAQKVDGALSWARRSATTGLVLRGDPGMGKTSLVVAMFDAWLAVHQDPSARFVEAFQLAQARARHPLGHGEAPLVEAAMGAGLLVLDDMGCESAAKSDVIFDVLAARHNDERPTWITTWLGVEEMAQRYGGGGFRRIVEGSNVVVLGVA